MDFNKTKISNLVIKQRRQTIPNGTRTNDSPRIESYRNFGQKNVAGCGPSFLCEFTFSSSYIQPLVPVVGRSHTVSPVSHFSSYSTSKNTPLNGA